MCKQSFRLTYRTYPSSGAYAIQSICVIVQQVISYLKTSKKCSRTSIITLAEASKSVGESTEMQKFKKLDGHRILRLVTTRWLSRLSVVLHYLKQWERLYLFFQSESFNKGNKPAKATAILEKLLSPIFEAYFSCLAYMPTGFESQCTQFFSLGTGVSGVTL